MELVSLLLYTGSFGIRAVASLVSLANIVQLLSLNVDFYLNVRVGVRNLSSNV